MAATQLKQKIQKSLGSMNDNELRSAFLVLQEINNQKQQTSVNKERVEKQISVGINELNNGLGTDFNFFLNDVKAKYGIKK